MTEKEKKDIERQVQCFILFIDEEYPDIPTDEIFSFIMAKTSTFFVKALNEKEEFHSLRKFYPEIGANVDALLDKKIEK